VCHEDEPCEPYWRLIKGSFKPIRHWCVMGEIEEINYCSRPHLMVRTRFDEKVTIHFDLEEDTAIPSFSFDDALVGHTILIMYAEKHDFRDMSTGVQQEAGDSVVIFKCGMQTLIKTFGSMMAPPACFQCDANQSSSTQNLASAQQENLDSIDQDLQPTSASLSLKKSAICGIALYCNKLCQTQHWKDNHKKLCSSMKYLQLLRELDFTYMSRKSVKECPAFSFSV
jgi:hypothetical protein